MQNTIISHHKPFLPTDSFTSEQISWAIWWIVFCLIQWELLLITKGNNKQHCIQTFPASTIIITILIKLTDLANDSSDPCILGTVPVEMAGNGKKYC